MPIIKAIKAGNGIAVSYHQPIRIESDLVSGQCLLLVASWPDEATKLEGLSSPFTFRFTVPTDMVTGEGTLVDRVEAALVASATLPFFGGEITSDKTQTLETIKARKNAEINRARLAANRTSFPFQGKLISFDELSQLDISTTNGGIALRNAMPPNWAGGWKAVDNTYVTIPDVATWIQFYGAIEAQGSANFEHAQALKVTLEAATTVEEIDAVAW